MFAIDTNLLIYAHNEDSEYHKRAVKFIEQAMNERDDNGNFKVCLLTQVLIEFINVITRQSLQRPLSLEEAIDVVHDYLDTGIQIVFQRGTQVQTFLELLKTVTTRRKIFDVALAATLRDNDIRGLYTVNTTDFDGFDFLTVINPLKN